MRLVRVGQAMVFVLAFGMTMGVNAEAVVAERLFVPTGTQPQDAWRGLCRMADGEVRHYGFEGKQGERRRIYIASRDDGDSWTRCLARTSWEDAMVKCPWADYWLTICSLENSQSRVIKSKRGPGDPESRTFQVSTPNYSFNRQPFPLVSRRRWIAPGNCSRHVKGRRRSWECSPMLEISDDDGETWRSVVVQPVVTRGGVVPPDHFERWENFCCEPTVLEMKDGSLWMVVRTTKDVLYSYRSNDGGDTWTGPKPMPGFYISNTMPTLHRMKDGRIVLFWNNTQPLPLPDPANRPDILPHILNGSGECAFTNRDALHAAISEDEGETWIGLREIRLLDIANRADYRQYGNIDLGTCDKSVHQNQVVERGDGKLIVANGQSAYVRRIGVFDPACLYATNRFEDFREGLVHVSTHLYVESLCGDSRFLGHCSWNRTNGALLVPEPGDRLSKREVLQLCRIPDPRLYSDRQGVVWNFPAAKKGWVELECRIDGEGFAFTLADRWFNPCDGLAPKMSPLTMDVRAADLGGAGRWVHIRVEFDAASHAAVLKVDGREIRRMPFDMKGFSPWGVSYLHLLTLAEGMDAKGAYFRSFNMVKEL